MAKPKRRNQNPPAGAKIENGTYFDGRYTYNLHPTRGWRRVSSGAMKAATKSKAHRLHDALSALHKCALATRPEPTIIID